jgi:ankyrin repeat protein
MKKSVVILALALGFSTVTVNALNFETTSDLIEVKANDSRVSPLCAAVAKGDLTSVKQLIKQGADVNEKSNGMLPIHYAAKYNRVDAIKVLITAGSEIHTRCDKGYTALKHAEKTQAKDAAKFLKRFKDKSA